MLDHRRFSHPLQAVEPFRAGDGSLCQMMLNISGGMAGGDRLRTTIEFERDAHAVLITASAAKAYRTRNEPAVQETHIRLERGAIVEYLPDHLIPHAGAAVEQTLRIEMGQSSRAIMYDALAAGRIGRGERWRFRELTSTTMITSATRPLYLNRSRITPASQPLDQPGWMEGYNYLATMVVAADSDRDWTALVAAFDSVLRRVTGVQGGASAMAYGGCVARFITATADALNRTAMTLWGIARKDLIGLEAFSLRKF